MPPEAARRSVAVALAAERAWMEERTLPLEA
jgi:hypothetical protein